MLGYIFSKLTTIKNWQLLLISLILSEAFTAIMNTIMGLIWWRRIDIDLLLIGTVDAFVVALIVTIIIIMIFQQIRNYERCSEEALREVNIRLEKRAVELDKLHKAISVATEGIALTDENDRFIYVNDAHARIYGYLHGEIIGKTWRDIITPELATITEKELLKTLHNRDVGIWSGESPALRKDGTIIPTEVTTSSRWNEAGNYLGHVCIVHDITERKRAEEELNKYRGQLEELVEERTKEVILLNDQLRQSQKLEAVGLLAGGVAHDFNNILATISGSMYIIRKHLGDDSPLLKYVEQVQSSVNKANNVAQSLLTFSRKQNASLEPLDINELIKRTKRLLIQVLGENIETHLFLAPRKMVVMANEDQMVRILLNLASNARDAMPDTGNFTIKTDIVVMDDPFIRKHGFGAAGKYVLLSVSDTGTGMVTKIKEKMFEPFFTTKEVGKGSGLGLAVAYGIVKQHKGYVSCDSLPQEGTTFRIYLPALETEPVQYQQILPLSVSEGTETILLAEDDPATRKTLSEVLRLSGYTVIEATDGVDGVRLYSEHEGLIDLVLLDVRMPKMNGREVYESVRKANPGTSVLFISGYTDDIIDGAELLPTELNFISKASLPDEILRKVREVLDSKRQRN